MRLVEKIKVKFSVWKCKLGFATYGNKRLVIRLVDIIDEVQVATATVNIPHRELAEDEVFIKSYGENEGMVEALVKAKVLEIIPNKVDDLIGIYKCKLKIKV